MTGVSGPPNSQPPPPELVLRQGPQPGQRFPLNKSALTIGREAGNDLVIGDSEVSRRHASLTWDGSHWIIEDLGSANGTSVNGVRITGPKVLERGDVIGLARTVTMGLETPVAAHVPGPPDPQTLVSAYPDPAHPPAPAAATHVPSPAPRSGNIACIVIPVVVLLGLGVVLVAAAAGYYYLQRSAAPRPVVLIREPRGGDELELGEEVMVQSVARDPQKIRRVELWIDGELQKAETSKVRTGTSPFPLLVRWQPETAGRHTLLARAFNSKGGLGQSSINIEVLDEPDRDDDGVVDDADACPDTPGAETADGCPDRDIDGIADDRDVCPDESGLLETQGCPSPQADDRDGDGLLDVADVCPDQVGPPLADGCPDVDRDGVLDAEDACPSEPGLPERAGCPLPDDRDADGVPDSQDVCPDQWGEVQHEGCPDRDADGVRDLDDDCPGDWGEPQLGGCPDQDRDGVPDRVDPCPHEAGPAELHGCPDNGAGDRDDDGIPDDGDLNPDEWGLPENGGGPGPGEGRDEDDDGLPDNEEGPDDPLGRINWADLVSGVLNSMNTIDTMEFQALEFEVDQDYDQVTCYASMAGSDWDQYGPFDSLGQWRWDIVAALGGESGVHLAVPEGEPLEIRANCEALVFPEGAGGQPPDLYDLGSISQQHPPEDWNGEEILAQSEGGVEGHSFRVKYRICAGTCDPTTLRPPVITMLETLGQTRLHWTWEGDRNDIDGFHLYINDSHSRTIPRDVYSHRLDVPFPWILPCGETHKLHMTVSRGEEESPPSNPWFESAGECTHTVRVTFDSLQTGEIGGVTGPIGGDFYAARQHLTFASSDYRLSPNHDYRVNDIFEEIREADAACRANEAACPTNEAPSVNYVTVRFADDGEYMAVVGQIADDQINSAGLYFFEKHFGSEDIPGEYTFSDRNIELKVLIEEIDGPEDEREGSAEEGGEGRRLDQDEIREGEREGGIGEGVEVVERSLPDLTLQCVMGGATMSIDVRNIGDVDVAGAPIELKATGRLPVGGPFTEPVVLERSDTIAAHTTLRWELPVDVADLPMPVLFEVDPNDLIEEEFEDNNILPCRWAALPDLEIQSGRWEGDQLVSFEIVNLGGGNVEDTDIYVHVVDPANHESVATLGIWGRSLPAGDTLTVDDIRSAHLSSPVALVVDPNHLIEEVDENNNFTRFEQP